MSHRQLLARGIGASPGIATGKIVFRAEDALASAARGESVILVRIDATGEDVPAMKVAVGIVTTHGGITGDAAIVARSLGKPCIAACARLYVDYTTETVRVVHEDAATVETVLGKGDIVTIDGGKGEIWR